MASRIPKACPAIGGGFTLIELIVVIAIVLFIFVGTIANYNAYGDKERVRQAASTFKGDVRLSLTKVTSALKPTGCETLTSYELVFPNTCDTACYEVTPVCSTSVGETFRVTLPNGVHVTSTDSPINFLPLAGGTDLASDANITFTGVSSYTVTVTITKSGSISEQ